jgi:O-antigen/teichoic acid export membrane protein
MAESKDLRTKVLSSLRWSTSVRFAGQLLTWILTIAVIRFVSPEDYGLMAMATLPIGISAIFCELGLATALVQKPEVTNDDLSLSLGALLAASVACVLLLYVLAPGISNFFDQPVLTLVIRVSSLQLVLTALSLIPGAMLMREMEFKTKSLVDLFAGVSGGVVSLTLAVNGAGVWALVAGVLATHILRTAGLYLAAPVTTVPRLSFRASRDLLRVGTAVTTDKLVWFTYSRADIFFLSRFATAEIVGLYQVAMQLAIMLTEKANPILNEIALPAFARLRNETAQIKKQLSLVFSILAFIFLPIFVGMAVVAPELIDLVLGTDWNPMWAMFAILSLVMPLRMASNINTSALQGIGQSSLAATNQLITLAILVPSLFIASRFGPEPTAIAWLIAFPVCFAIELIRSKSATSLSLSDAGKPIARTVMVTVLMGVSVLMARKLLPESGSNMVILAVLVSVGVLTYAAGCALLNRKSMNESMSLAANTFGLR